ncbi:MAG: hypothetical protein GY716_21785 [bacterium]|nr:hypothetical protein [bacterium]
MLGPLVLSIALATGGAASAQTCLQDTQCEFNNTLAIRRGVALLTIAVPDELQVGNFGVLDAVYGVEFIRLPGFSSESAPAGPQGQAEHGDVPHVDAVHGSSPRVPRDSHDEWIEMGIVAFAAVESVDESDTGSFIEFFSFVNKETTVGGVATTVSRATHRFEDVGSTVEVTTDFSKFQSSSLTYEIYNGGGLVASTSGQALDSIATVGDWPDTHKYSEILWNQQISITIPNGVSSVSGTGNQLRIYPDAHVEQVDNTTKHGWDAKGVDAQAQFAGGIPVESLTVIDVSVPTGTLIVTMPALTDHGLAALLIVIVLVVIVVARRRIPG